MVEEGSHEDAHEALDRLLSLGPGNLEALKLKCFLYSVEGRFYEESRVWERVLDQDYEDLDALYFFQRRHLEEKESFYFTDRLPSGGRRFLAHPRALINASLGGLLGCTLFLVVSSYAQKYYILSSPLVSFSSFFLFVVVPWFFIILTWFRSLREILITSESILFNTRIKCHDVKWRDVESVYLAHVHVAGEQKLSLIILPRDPALSVYELDLSRDTSAVRARALFIEEINRLFREPVYVSRSDINLPVGKLISF